MNILRLAILLLNFLLSARADQLDTLEDNIVIEDFDQFSGSGDEVCDDGSGSGEESEAYSVESAEYSMTTSGTVGLDIDISLQRMSDSSVQMVCKMKRTEVLKEVEGSGAASDTSDVFPASIYLIRDIAVCADLATAVGNDITTSALKLVDVSGPGEDVERLGVSWDLIRQTHCMAVLRESEEGSGDEAVVVEARLSLPGPRCGRRERMLVSSPSTRVFTSINLASFALISLGVTAAFTVAAASPAVQNFINNNNNNNNNLGAEQAVASFFLTVTPVALLLGYYYVFTRRSSLKRKFDNFSRRVSQQMVGARMDYIQEKVSTLVQNVESSLEFPMLRQFGDVYMQNLRRGPLGLMMRLGSRVMNVLRRSDTPQQFQRDRLESKKYNNQEKIKPYNEEDNYYYYEEYENIPSHRYDYGYGYDEY